MTFVGKTGFKKVETMVIQVLDHCKYISSAHTEKVTTSNCWHSTISEIPIWMADLENAIAAVKQKGLKVPLVVFGHMHQSLQLGPILERTMVVVGSDRTVYLNAAVVPRVRYKMISQTGSLHRNNLLDGVGRFGREVESKHDTEHSGTSLAGALHRLDLGIGITERHFVLVDFDDGEVKKIKEVWVAIGDGACTDEQKILYSSDSVPASSWIAALVLHHFFQISSIRAALTNLNEEACPFRETIAIMFRVAETPPHLGKCGVMWVLTSPVAKMQIMFQHCFLSDSQHHDWVFL